VRGARVKTIVIVASVNTIKRGMRVKTVAVEIFVTTDSTNLTREYKGGSQWCTVTHMIVIRCHRKMKRQKQNGHKGARKRLKYRHRAPIKWYLTICKYGNFVLVLQ